MWVLAGMGLWAVAITIERWLDINARTDYDAAVLFEKIKNLVYEKKLEDAFKICAAGGKRALPRILGAGIRKAISTPGMISRAMEEESVHMNAALERRLNFLVMFGNVATLLGLLGTVFGLIMSFAAVGKPGVAAVEKSAMLASGISAAMNSTLVGLAISIPCVLAYALLRARVDHSIQEIDRYAVAVLNLINPPDMATMKYKPVVRMSGEEEVPDTDVTPMLNLMVLLIPFLLSSSEFVKIGAIELKLPESSQGSGGEGSGMVDATKKNAKLELGIIITDKGFNLFHYFKQEKSEDAAAATLSEKPVDIPKINGEYDFKKLNSELAKVKTGVLNEMLRAYYPSVPADASLYQLHKTALVNLPADLQLFNDYDAVKIVAEEKIKYETVIAVMDAARGTRTPDGDVTMFPNVSIAGGIIQ